MPRRELQQGVPGGKVAGPGQRRGWRWWTNAAMAGVSVGRNRQDRAGWSNGWLRPGHRVHCVWPPGGDQVTERVAQRVWA